MMSCCVLSDSWGETNLKRFLSSLSILCSRSSLSRRLLSLSAARDSWCCLYDEVSKPPRAGLNAKRERTNVMSDWIVFLIEVFALQIGSGLLLINHLKTKCSALAVEKSICQPVNRFGVWCGGCWTSEAMDGWCRSLVPARVWRAVGTDSVKEGENKCFGLL